MRKRLTDKVAAEIMNDPYQVNNPEHEKNDPKIDAYAKGDPEKWGEGVNKDNMWEQDKRTETNHPEITAKMAAEAVQSAKHLEEKAVKCIVASQRILPGADENVLEVQAAELMHMPDTFLDSLLSRQEELAANIAKFAAEAEDEDEEAAKAANEEEDDKMAEIRAKKAALEKELADLNKSLEAGDEETEEEESEEEESEEKKSEEKKPEEEESEEEESEEEESEEEESEEDETEKEASNSLLDDIFASVTASEKKVGAKKLSGMVKKQASEGSDDLSKLWSAPPDVSKHF